MSEILQIKRICKSFPGVAALQNVNLTVKGGEVLALMGENGAGKSTLIKILAGVYPKDSGAIFFDGREVEIKSPYHSRAMGISVIFQELNLLPNLSIGENIFMGREQRSLRVMLHRNRTNALAAQLMRRVGLTCSPNQLVKDLPVSQRQMVEVAKALSLDAKLIIMDEPTSSLTEHETQLLFAIIRKLKQAGVAIIFVSHRMNEVFEIADRVHVLRDGVDVGELERGAMTEDAVIQMMVGRELSRIFTKKEAPVGAVALEVKHLSTPGLLNDINFTLRKGEILGIAGLVGAGRTELMRAIFGVDPYAAGQILIRGQLVKIDSAEKAIRQGLALVPEDRRNHGLIVGMSVRENSSLVVLGDGRAGLHRYGLVKPRAERGLVDRFIQVLGIKTPHREQKVANLSGGNQQKVVLAKWLATHPEILILDEPTRGIDVGAKKEIHTIMSDLAAQGVAIIMISSELEEILGMSDRILVMHEGRITGELSREAASQERIMALAIS